MLTWDTLIFVLPIVMAMVLGTGALTGGFGDDVDIDLDLDVDGDADVDGEAEPSAWLNALAWLGVGRAPIMILLTVALLTFGVVGLVLKPLLGPILALVMSLVLTPVATSSAGRTLARYMPTSESYVVGRHALVGCSGTARLPVTRTFGVAQVIDESGTFHEVRCRIDDTIGDGSISKGDALVIVDYEESTATYTVAALNDAIAQRSV